VLDDEDARLCPAHILHRDTWRTVIHRAFQRSASQRVAFGCIGRRYLDVARTAWLSPLRATPWYPRRPYERALARSATPLNSALEQGLPPQSRYIARLARGGMPRVAGLDLAGRPADFRPRPGADEGERRPALTTARLTGCGATVICCSGAGLPTEGSVQEGFADHVEQLSKVITYTPPSGPT
jgi:hypothetical protein